MNHMPSLTIAMVMMTALPYQAAAEPNSPARGERMYRACVACHSLEPNRNMTGPSLAEIWNRQAGSLASFPRYSPALKSSGIIWNDDTLDEWIKDPQHFIPGNTMTFAGMKDRRQRADLLAFLKDASQPGHALHKKKSAARPPPVSGEVANRGRPEFIGFVLTDEKAHVGALAASTTGRLLILKEGATKRSSPADQVKRSSRRRCKPRLRQPNRP